ncbi:MAG: MFS transporter [Steroidobacteraceae bacterium]|jgi:MFS family permease
MLERHLWRDFVGVTSSVAVLGVGVGSTLPLTALALTARGLGPEVVGWMTAATAVGGIGGTLAAPWATLRFGRRLVMLCCVAVAAASVMCLQYVDSLWGWGGLRALFGVSMAPLFVIGEAWINSLPGDAVRGRVVAIYTTSFTLCQMLGPLLTDALAGRPQHAFVICGAVFLLGLPGIGATRDAARAADPAAAPAGRKNAVASWWTIVRTAPAIIAGAALFAAFDNIILSFLPLFALDRAASQSRALAAVMLVFVGDAALQFAAGWLADHFGHARMHRLGGLALCVLLPLLPWMIAVPGLWEAYLLLLGGVAGSVYTLSMVSSGERFSGAALLRASGLIALTWSLASSVGAAATGVVMQYFGSGAMTAVLLLMALGFVAATHAERPASL